MAENPMNPLWYELKARYLQMEVFQEQTTFKKRAAEEGEDNRIGWQIRETDHGLLVTRVLDGSPAFSANISVGDFIMSINARRVWALAQVQLSLNQTLSCISIARKRPAILNMDTVVIPGRRDGWEYLTLRLECLGFDRLGMTTGMVNGKVVALAVETGGAAHSAGFKVRDRLIGVGPTALKPRDQNHLKWMLDFFRQEPIDMIVERKKV